MPVKVCGKIADKDLPGQTLCGPALFKNKKVIVEYNGIQREVSTSEKDLSNLLPAYPVSSYKLTDGTFEMKYQIKELQYYTLG